jgi:hypothetical protein
MLNKVRILNFLRTNLIFIILLTTYFDLLFVVQNKLVEWLFEKYVCPSLNVRIEQALFAFT